MLRRKDQDYRTRLLEAAARWEREADDLEAQSAELAAIGMVPMVALKRRVAANMRALAGEVR